MQRQLIETGMLATVASLVLAVGVLGWLDIERDLFALTVVILLACCLGAILLGLRLLRMVSEPVTALVETARRISTSQDYSIRAERVADEEIGALVDAFNEMLEQIERWKEDVRSQGSERTLALQSAMRKAFRSARQAREASRAKSAPRRHRRRTGKERAVPCAAEVDKLGRAERGCRDRRPSASPWPALRPSCRRGCPAPPGSAPSDAVAAMGRRR